MEPDVFNRPSQTLSPDDTPHRRQEKRASRHEDSRPRLRPADDESASILRKNGERQTLLMNTILTQIRRPLIIAQASDDPTFESRKGDPDYILANGFYVRLQEGRDQGTPWAQEHIGMTLRYNPCLRITNGRPWIGSCDESGFGVSPDFTPNPEE